MNALTRLRLIDRSNLGISRMFTALLIEGKKPPLIEDQREAVKVTFLASELSAPFRAFVAEESRDSRQLSVDHLLVLRYLLRHTELDTVTAAHLCQRQEADARELLSEMERSFGYLERCGTTMSKACTGSVRVFVCSPSGWNAAGFACRATPANKS